MARVMYVLTVIATLLTASPTSNVLAHDGTATSPPPLFGAKPELYLSPTFGNPGNHIHILGLGFRPHASVYVVFLQSEKSGFSLKVIQQAIKVHTQVNGGGTFRATYILGPDMDPGQAPAVIYFAFATYDGDPHTLLARKLGGTAFVVCAMCVSR